VIQIEQLEEAHNILNLDHHHTPIENRDEIDCYSTTTVNRPQLNNGSGSIYPMLREGESIPSATVLIFFIGRLRTGGMYQMLHYFSAVYCMILYLLSHPMQYRVFGSQLQRICNHNLCLDQTTALRSVVAQSVPWRTVARPNRWEEDRERLCIPEKEVILSHSRGQAPPASLQPSQRKFSLCSSNALFN
jgi:hypothetical protein